MWWIGTHNSSSGINGSHGINSNNRQGTFVGSDPREKRDGKTSNFVASWR